jgi:hypothetical protein
MKSIQLILVLFFLQVSFPVSSQTGADYPIDFKRVRLHEDIDRIQVEISRIRLPETIVNDRYQSIPQGWYLERIDSLQKVIETSVHLSHRLQVKYLTGVLVLLQSIFEQKQRIKDEYSGNELINCYLAVIEIDIANGSLIDIVKRNSYFINTSIFGKATVFFDHPEIVEIRGEVYKQFAALYPEKILATIDPFLEYPFSDSLLTQAANKYPSSFYDYAAAFNSGLGKKIKTIKDPFVQLLYKVAQEKSGRLLFPFVPLLLEKKLSYEKLKAIVSKEAAYYSKLVDAKIELSQKQSDNIASFFSQEVEKMIIRKSEEIFINKLNARHELSDSARFAIVNSFSAEDIYYLIVSGENTLYTSSYLGLYNRMLSRSAQKRGDSILQKVGYDHFRKFLKMASGYNKLNDFLAAMPDSTATSLVKQFVAGLDGMNGIVEAVDVADAFASMSDSLLREKVIEETKKNLLVSKRSGNKNGELVYQLLNTLFGSSDSLHLALDSTYHVRHIFDLPYLEVADISGKVVEQVFFYGDKDSKLSFDNFMDGFRDKAEWKVVEKEYWVEIRSLIGKSIWIFANLPLQGTNEDENYIKAQRQLNKHLDSMGIKPSIVVHRGHSYYLKQTINQFPSEAKLVMVGSCGGYNLLNAILEKYKQAHIISTKEVGTKTVNDPILKLINESIRNGKDIYWEDFWKKLEFQFSKSPDKLRFENYIPPHKNFGALFIKAYASIEGASTSSN